MGGKGFVEDMREYIAQLNREKRYSSAKSYQEVLDSFIKYSGTDIPSCCDTTLMKKPRGNIFSCRSE